MKALSLYQPWATLVVIGAKRIETRSWRTSYRGAISIHASSSRRNQARLLAYQKPFYPLLEQAGISPLELPFGAIIGTVKLFDCVPITGGLPNLPAGYWQRDDELLLGDYSPGRWAWLFTDPQRLPQPVPHRGKMGLYRLDGPDV